MIPANGSSHFLDASDAGANFAKGNSALALIAIVVLIRILVIPIRLENGISDRQSMADFKTHITTSSIIGVFYGGAGYCFLDVGVAHCLIAGSLCGVAGMLPDLDSNSGKPQREMLSFVSVVLPMLMMSRFQEFGLTSEQLVFISGVMYVIIRFGVGGVFRRFTKHRGMWHSIPAAVIAGMITYLAVLSADMEIRLFKAWAVVLGFVTHLVLDEIYAVNWEGKLPKFKKSFGTALKFFGNDIWPNVLTYAKLAILIAIITGDGYVMDSLRQPRSESFQMANDWLRDMIGDEPGPTMSGGQAIPDGQGYPGGQSFPGRLTVPQTSIPIRR